jgi:hypothetical protein
MARFFPCRDGSDASAVSLANAQPAKEMTAPCLAMGWIDRPFGLPKSE